MIIHCNGFYDPADQGDVYPVLVAALWRAVSKKPI